MSFQQPKHSETLGFRSDLQVFTDGYILCVCSGCSTASYLSHDVSLTASVTVLLQIARVPSVSSVVCRLAGRVTDRQAALEVHRQLCKALCDTIIILRK